MKTIQTWELKKGDKVRFDNEIYTFRKMDGMYGQWTNEKNEILIGNFPNLLLGDDGVYYQANQEII